jgi:hypothetical protein
MLLELAKPVALLLCILSLYAVFHTAFLIPASNLDQRISDSLQLLAVAAGIALVSGFIFLEPVSGQSPGQSPGRSLNSTRLIATLPMQLFCWTVAALLILFLATLYLGSQCPIDCRDHLPTS